MKGWLEEGRRDRLEKRLRGIRLLNAAGTPTIKEMVMTVGGCKKRRDERMTDKFSERGEFVAEPEHTLYLPECRLCPSGLGN